MKGVVLITGASSGIGRSIAEYLSEKKFKVYGTCRNPKKYVISSFDLLKCDITNNKSIIETIEYIILKENRIDILINNVGVGISGPIEETSQKEILEAFRINCFGPIEITKECIPHMREQKKGLIINITSVLGYFGNSYRGIYSATKSSMEMIGETLSMELKKFNIKVVNVAPGDFKTEIITRRIYSSIDKESVYYDDYQKSLNKANAHVNNASSPEIIAELIFKIIMSKNPKIHYTVGKFIQKFSIVLKKILPQRLFEKLLMNYT
tara:strand:- start:479 stop:1276 length:798 start_codon:yes stop_codon:yes gene_type:complete